MAGGDIVGIFAVDPGNSTGIAWGLFDETADTVAEALAGRTDSGSDTLTGDPVTQGREICTRWRQFFRACYFEHKLHPSNVYLIMEDFILSPQAPPGKDIVMPVKIAYFVIGFRHGQATEYERSAWGPAVQIQMTWQTAGMAKGYAKDMRLKRWGIWTKGREHERDAWRHVAYFLYMKLK